MPQQRIDERHAESQLSPIGPLAEMVQTALRRNPHVADRQLRFETRQGRVVLRGTVASYYQKQMAQEAVRGVEGVASVENHLEVESAHLEREVCVS